MTYHVAEMKLLILMKKTAANFLIPLGKTGSESAKLLRVNARHFESTCQNIYEIEIDAISDIYERQV